MAVTLSLHDRLMLDLQSVVRALGLAGVPGVVADVGQNVVVEEQDWNGDYPAVFLTARGPGEESPNDLSNTEQVGLTYRVAVLVCDVPQVTMKDAGPVYKGWRERMRAALHEKSNYATTPNLLPGSPECAFTICRFGKVLGEGPTQELCGHENVVNGLVVECHCAVAR